MISDYHLHTCFSGDCETPPQEMIEQAIKLGMDNICFTDHRDVDHPEQIFTLDTPAYMKKMNELQEQYSKQIDIRIGVELGLQEHLVENGSAYVAKYPFDFVLGSIHIVNGEDPYNPEYFEGKTDEQAFREYFEQVYLNVKLFSDFQVLGHLDYVIRYAKQSLDGYSYAVYAEEIDKILRTIIDKGIGLEVNTGGYRCGLGCSNPRLDVFKRYKKLGGEIITFGSDAHMPRYIGDEFERAREIIKSVGFKYYAQYRQRKLEMKEL